VRWETQNTALRPDCLSLGIILDLKMALRDFKKYKNKKQKNVWNIRISDAVAATVDCYCWLSLLTATVDCYRWLLPLTATIDCYHWLQPLTAVQVSQYPSVAVSQYRNVPVSQVSPCPKCLHLSQWPSGPMSECPNVWVSQSPSVPMSECPNVLMS
jgi:hypothetical protein